MPTIFLIYNLVHAFLLSLLPKSLRRPLQNQAKVNKRRSSAGVANKVEMQPTELKRVFQMFDRNGDGRISKEELSHSLENLGIFIPDQELFNMINKIDVDGDGCVDIDEFGELYQFIMDERDDEDDMKEAFGVFDQNGDGFITVDELRTVLSSLGLKQGRSMEDCTRMITKVDVDGDGMVNYNEFRQLMKGGGFGDLTLLPVQPTK
ncbi:hypothetical protein ACLB2K_037768 [Fragaria x ananassa]